MKGSLHVGISLGIVVLASSAFADLPEGTYRAKNPSLTERAKASYRDSDLEEVKAYWKRGVSPVEGAVQGQLGFFRFVPGFSCDNGYIQADYCEAAKPKSWEASEIQLFSKLVAGFARQYPRFFHQIMKNGFTRIVRYENIALPSSEGKFEPATNGGQVHTFDESIRIPDRLIQGIASGYKPAEAILFHELVHAFDFRTEGEESGLPQWSFRPEFLSLSGYSLSRQGDWKIKNVSERELEQIIEWSQGEYAKASENEDDAKRYKEWERIGAIVDDFAHKRGFPSLYSIQSMQPLETFAEVVTYTHFNPELMERINPKLKAWVTKNILK